jgi:hypothetical protein
LQPSRRHAFQQQKLTSQADPPADSSPISKQHQPAKEAKSKSHGGTTQQECIACPAKRQVSEEQPNKEPAKANNQPVNEASTRLNDSSSQAGQTSQGTTKAAMLTQLSHA